MAIALTSDQLNFKPIFTISESLKRDLHSQVLPQVSQPEIAEELKVNFGIGGLADTD